MTDSIKLGLNDSFENESMRLNIGDSLEIKFDGMLFVGRLTEIAPDLHWEQKPGGSSVTGSIRLTLDVGAMGPCTLKELTEWLRRRKQ